MMVLLTSLQKHTVQTIYSTLMYFYFWYTSTHFQETAFAISNTLKIRYFKTFTQVEFIWVTLNYSSCQHAIFSLSMSLGYLSHLITPSSSLCLTLQLRRTASCGLLTDGATRMSSCRAVSAASLIQRSSLTGDCQSAASDLTCSEPRIRFIFWCLHNTVNKVMLSVTAVQQRIPFQNVSIMSDYVCQNIFKPSSVDDVSECFLYTCVSAVFPSCNHCQRMSSWKRLISWKR